MAPDRRALMRPVGGASTPGKCCPRQEAGPGVAWPVASVSHSHIPTASPSLGLSLSTGSCSLSLYVCECGHKLTILDAFPACSTLTGSWGKCTSQSWDLCLEHLFGRQIPPAIEELGLGFGRSQPLPEVGIRLALPEIPIRATGMRLWGWMDAVLIQGAMGPSVSLLCVPI